jgi:predicted amidohydrolase YtcJ
MAEVVFTGGAVITMTGERPEEEALAMREGRIVAVGSREEVLADRAPDAIVVDLDGGRCYLVSSRRTDIRCRWRRH